MWKMFKVNNKDTKIHSCSLFISIYSVFTCSKLTAATRENWKNLLQIFPSFSIFLELWIIIVDFEDVNIAGYWSRDLICRANILKEWSWLRITTYCRFFPHGAASWVVYCNKSSSQYWLWHWNSKFFVINKKKNKWKI